MSLATILEAIRATGETQINEIEQQAYAQTRQILAEAQEKARDLREETRAATLSPAYRERARLLHRARLEALRITGNARDSLVSAALGQTRGRLSSFRNNPAYPQVLQRLVSQAVEELRACLEAGDKICLEADARDQDLLGGILSDFDGDLLVRYDLECWGGVVARSENGRITVINTLEARLERATPYLRRCLSAQFEKEAGESEADHASEGANA